MKTKWYTVISTATDHSHHLWSKVNQETVSRQR